MANTTSSRGSCGNGSPWKAAVSWANNHGLPRQPRPTTTPSAPVWAIMARASTPVQISPLPKTGVFHWRRCSLRFAIACQSALPPYICAAVRPCSATQATPARAALSPASKYVRWVSSIPLRIFTDTGTFPSAASTTRSTISRKRSRFHGNALPPPLRVTLGTGQPKFMSIWSARSSSIIIRAAAAMTCGSTPYSCTDRGDSSGAKVTRSMVASLRSISARDVTISET